MKGDTIERNKHKISSGIFENNNAQLSKIKTAKCSNNGNTHYEVELQYKKSVQNRR